MKDSIDLAFSFDTTGSMSPCIKQVRKFIEKTVKDLLKIIPNLLVAILAHGDYCDGKQVLTALDFTSNVDKLKLALPFIQYKPWVEAKVMPSTMGWLRFLALQS